jgi:D-glycero-D-manno-heptose 1,7-bisphosphate phosphatase
MINRAAFLDRDGVINRKPPGDEYVTRWEDMHFLPGVAESIALLNQAGFRVIVVSNQRCVSNGLVTSHTLDSIHRQMCERLATAGAKIDAVYYCPHEKQPPCTCRKPAPGMLLAAARAYQIDLAASWVIGDSDIDVEAGRNAGCRTVRLVRINENERGSADVFSSSLLEAICQILRQDEIIAHGQANAVPTFVKGPGKLLRLKSHLWQA